MFVSAWLVTGNWCILSLINLHIKSISDLLSCISKHWMCVVSVGADFCGCCLWEDEQFFPRVWEVSETSLLYCYASAASGILARSAVFIQSRISRL